MNVAECFVRTSHDSQLNTFAACHWALNSIHTGQLRLNQLIACKSNYSKLYEFSKLQLLFTIFVDVLATGDTSSGRLFAVRCRYDEQFAIDEGKLVGSLVSVHRRVLFFPDVYRFLGPPLVDSVASSHLWQIVRRGEQMLSLSWMVELLPFWPIQIYKLVPVIILCILCITHEIHRLLEATNWTNKPICVGVTDLNCVSCNYNCCWRPTINYADCVLSNSLLFIQTELSLFEYPTQQTHNATVLNDERNKNLKTNPVFKHRKLCLQRAWIKQILCDIIRCVSDCVTSVRLYLILLTYLLTYQLVWMIES